MIELWLELPSVVGTMALIQQRNTIELWLELLIAVGTHNSKNFHNLTA